MKLESLWEDPPMPVSEHITFIPSVKTKLGFDEIYLVSERGRFSLSLSFPFFLPGYNSIL